MTKRTILTVLFLASLVIGLSAPALAEVSARTDRYGNYLGLQISPAGPANGQPWSVRGTRFARRGAPATAGATLNPGGDRLGDGWPSAIENSRAPHYPWVVWSRHNGVDYDLAFSRWTRWGWMPVDWVLPEPFEGDDVKPSLGFDPSGRAVVAWSHQTDGESQVYVSLFLKRNWSVPIRISDVGLDSGPPELSTQGSGLLLRFASGSQTVERLLRFDGPLTITDDINPQAWLNVMAPGDLAQD